MKKLIISFVCFAMLCGCSINVDRNIKNNTNSNTTQTTSTTETTTDSVSTPTAEAVFNIESLTTDKVVWGPGVIENHEQPIDPVHLQEDYKNLDGVWLIDGKKDIALTFDEGYENGFTPAILDTLKEKKVKAVFFVTYDFASSNPELIKRMINEGHIVGNHSWHHYSMDELSVDKAREEVLYLHEYIKENFDYTMSYFRFPKGEFSQQSLGILKDLGYKSVFWSYAYEDWDTDKQPNKDEAFKNICNSTHPGEILLLHAVSSTNAEILGDVIDDIRHQGYKFTVSI